MLTANVIPACAPCTVAAESPISPPKINEIPVENKIIVNQIQLKTIPSPPFALSYARRVQNIPEECNKIREKRKKTFDTEANTDYNNDIKNQALRSHLNDMPDMILRKGGAAI